MFALLPLTAALLLSTTTTTTTTTTSRLPDDAVLRDVEQAFRILRADRPGARSRARAHLARVALVLDDLDPAGDDVALATGDRAAPWRGLPHERVLALLTLATLDVAVGRCDLALPTVKSAQHHHERAALVVGAAAADHDLALVELLRRRCVEGGVDAVDLVFRGRTPEVVAAGAYGEQAVLHHHDDDDTVAFVIRLGASRAERASSARETIVWDARSQAHGPGPASSSRRQQRAATKQHLLTSSTTWAAQGNHAALSARQSRSAREVMGAALLWSASAGAAISSATVDATVDTRVPSSMPARVSVVVVAVEP